MGCSLKEHFPKTYMDIVIMKNLKQKFHSVFNKHTAPKLAAAGLMAASLAVPEMALAGDATESSVVFGDVWATLKDWIQGTLGQIVAGAMILVGIIGGIARQSLMAFAIGIGGGIGLYNSPSIVEAVVSSTLEHADKAASVIQMTNGLL